ncbi:MAG TPA: endolytic transglycosylase MltG [Candidatus Paceibacterota bacterium]|nr:endolytic transglycosylase MltG [Candidatus Paceibacterota bacterium]
MLRGLRAYMTRLRAKDWKRIGKRAAFIAIALLVVSGLTYAHVFGPMNIYGQSTQFIVPEGDSASQVADMLQQQGFVRSGLAFQLALFGKVTSRGIRPGGYTISSSMDTWTIAQTLAQPPYLVFVTFPDGARKEQMADILADALFWTDAQKQEWLNVDTAATGTLPEGDYYPDTYLIPSDQSPAEVAARLRGRFTDVFAPYIAEAKEKGLDWNKVLTLASIVERESSKVDRPLVAGILWNRLDDGMKLQADATLQYIRGTEGDWWPTPHSADKYLKSPYNTYQHTGLPPYPIANPSPQSVAAVLDPENTDCIFYLHDANHQIHCSVTYAGQQHNVAKYLK